MAIPEVIVAAAIRIPVSDDLRGQMWNGERCYPDYMTISAPPPARHPTLILGSGFSNIKPEHQGFLTSHGRYVDREEALWIAVTCGQPMIDHAARHERHLFSEDLW